ncbi:MAG: hypothetical protein CMA18_002650 [Methanobacteriota archaeon]|nr:MAG: hypothetical protein CBC63_04145 [Euryarchaeota archaeon TMED103]RAH11819.1 MAG: hypothetical protein CMA18_002650 [Euryarchaeota archaeon]
MATKKTSAEEAREQAEEATLGSMLDGAFGAMEGIEASPAPTPSNPPATPSGPPTGPPSKPPTGPPSGPPTGPPSGPPTGPPSGPPGKPPSEPPSESSTEELSTEEESTEPAPQEIEEATVEPESSNDEHPIVEEEASEPVDEEAPAEPEEAEPEQIEEVAETEPEQEEESESVFTEEPAEALTEESAEESPPVDVDQAMEIARLTAEIERLRGGLVGAVEVIEEIEEEPLPPVVLEDIVVPSHMVADFARMGRQLSRESLIKGTMGAISMLHPDEPGMMISTRHSTMLSRLDERGIVGGRLGGNPPRGAISEWKIHEVLLASVALVTGGPAACIHMQGPYTTAASCEKDLILVQPIDVLGKEHIGKVVIVDPDDDAQEEFLRQVAEALQQGGMRCVVVRGHGAYAVGANLDQAMANAAMLEHSMQILLLARQANLKI